MAYDQLCWNKLQYQDWQLVFILCISSDRLVVAACGGFHGPSGHLEKTL